MRSEMSPAVGTYSENNRRKGKPTKVGVYGTDKVYISTAMEQEPTPINWVRVLWENCRRKEKPIRVGVYGTDKGLVHCVSATMDQKPGPINWLHDLWENSRRKDRPTRVELYGTDKGLLRYVSTSVEQKSAPINWLHDLWEDSRRKEKPTGVGVYGTDKGVLHYVSTATDQKPAPINWLRVLWEGAVAGATAGVVVETILYPIDTIKTRLQAAQAGGKIVFKGLYTGLAGNLVGVLPASAVFVGVYEPVKRKLLDSLPDNLSSIAHLTAGAVGGATASLIRVPTEVVKQRMQTLQFTSAPSAVRDIVAKEGFLGLYAGFGAFLLRDLPFDAIQFCIYEQLKVGYRKTVKRELYDPENAAMGAFAGAITGAVTTPLDVIKTRLMVQGSQGHYKGLIDCVCKIIKEEGSGTLLKGVGPRVMWIGIGGSIFFTALERTKALLAQQSWSNSDDFPNVRTA